MIAPRRVQISRQRGSRMEPGAVKVDRSTRWGNPYIVREERDLQRRRVFVVRGVPRAGSIIECGAFEVEEKARAAAVLLFEAALRNPGGLVRFTEEDVRRELRGRVLACWCDPLERCHADVLLRIANEDE